MTYSSTITGTSGLTNYWRFEGNGTATTGAAAMTIATGYSTSSAGFQNNGLTADSSATKTGSYTTGVANTFFNSTYSVELWFKAGQHRSSQQEIMRMSNDLALEIDTAGKINYYYNGTNATSTGTFDDNVWHHLVITRDGSRVVRIYVDTTQVGTFTANTSAPATGNLYFAGSQYTTQAFITGQMDEVALYNVALSGATISAHYSAGFTNGGYTAQAMTASASMPGGVKQQDNSYSASPMTASATAPLGVPAYFVNAYATDDVVTNSANPTSGGGSDDLALSPTHKIFVKFPQPTLSQGEGIAKAELVLTRKTGLSHAARTLTVATVDTDWSELSGTSYNSESSATTAYTVSDPGGAGGTELSVDITSVYTAPYGIRLSTATGSTSTFDSDEDTNVPYVRYLVTMAEAANGNVDAQPMSASAAMPTATLQFGVSPVAAPMIASGLMVDPIVVGQREAILSAEQMDAAATMPGGGFASPVSVAGNPFIADAETVDVTVETTSGVLYYADSMGATASWIKPALVNGEPIVVEEAEDKYFQRVFALAPSVWQRLDDKNSTAVDRMGTYNGTYNNVLVGRYDAPDGRHSVRFATAGANIEQTEPTGSNADEAWIQDGSALASTLEFSFKTDKANTFLMAGADSTQTSQGVKSSYAARELFLKNGKLTFKSRIFAGTPDQVDKEFTGPRVLNDGEWHSVVVKSGVYSRGQWATELWVDGTFEIRRFEANGFMGFPDYIGYRPSYIDGSELETLPLSEAFIGDMSEVVFYNHNNLPSHDIARNYYAFMAWAPIEASSMDASATFVDGDGRGNQKKALYLYFNPMDEVFQTGDAVPESLSFDPMPGFIERAFQAPNLPFTYEERIGDYHGYKVFGRSARVNTDNRAYRDPLTDDQSLINLEHDIDLSDYDVIMFKDWPDEGDELDDINYNYPGQKDRLLNQLRDANDNGVGLYVTNPRLAVDLGVIDDLEFVPTLEESKFSGNQGAAYGFYDYGSALKFPWNIAASDGLTGNQYAAGIGETQNLTDNYLDNKAYFYQDTNKNDRFRVRALIEGLTDIPSYMVEDAVFHIDYDQFGWQGVAYKYLEREDGLLIGDEYIFNGAETISAKYLDIVERRYNRFNGTWATPPGAVKAGTVVTTFGAKHWSGKVHTDNPYKDYATTIVLDRGDQLAGRPVGGRIFVNFSEQTSYGLGVPVQVLPEGAVGWPQGYPVETSAQKEWGYSWTRTSLTSTGQQATTSLSVVMPNGEVQIIKLGASGDNLAMVRSGQLFPVTGKARMEMTARGLYWIAAAEDEDPNAAVVRAEPFKATAEVKQPLVTAQRDVTIGAQPMNGLATMPKVAEDESGDVQVYTLPWTATASFTQYGKTVSAEPMLAAAEMVENFEVVHATGEQVVLTLHGFDAELYLKEEA